MATIFKQPVSATFGKWQFSPGSMAFSHTMSSPSVRNLLWAMGWQSITWFYFELLNQGQLTQDTNLGIFAAMPTACFLLLAYFRVITMMSNCPLVKQSILWCRIIVPLVHQQTDNIYSIAYLRLHFLKMVSHFAKKNVCLAMINNCILIIKILESNKYKLEIVEKIKQWRILLLTTQNLLKNPQYMQRTLMLMAFSSYL